MTQPTLRIATALALVVGLLTATACNRGYGCPTDFGVDAVASVADNQPGDCR